MLNESDQKDTSLIDLKCDLFEHYNCDVSKVAIHKRFNKPAVDFVKKVLSENIAYRFNVQSLELTQFTGIYIKDSTKFSIPKNLNKDYPGFNGFHKDQALMNIQYEYDLVSGNWNAFEITKATRNDQEDSKCTLDNIKEGSLMLRDLGYVTMNYLKGVIERKAYYLNRLPTTLNVYIKEGQKMKLLDWNEVDKQMKKRQLDQMELAVYLGKNELISSRLIIKSVPDEVYQKRIRKASKHAKSKGCQLSDDYKIKSKYTLLITNASKEHLSTSDISKVYSLRWQIELIFKTWKSNLKIHITKKVKKERFECQLIAKIIWILINWRLFQIADKLIKSKKSDSGCSIQKFFKYAKRNSASLREIIKLQEVPKVWFDKSFIPIMKDLIIEKKKGKQTHCQVFKQALSSLG